MLVIGARTTAPGPCGSLTARLGGWTAARADHPRSEENGMLDDTVGRFLKALSPAHREQVERHPRERQEELAAAWEEELRRDTDLDTLDELSVPAAESEAARRVMEKEAD
ncbi:hypothetical protein ACFVIM_26785 [Streptomyces sp. NPDC057638]|uniref:hypothetical protein n=1 Tax=Streptomyces sp. NPDC057638 TaxID=3346190 RepID=UPI0036958681